MKRDIKKLTNTIVKEQKMKRGRRNSKKWAFTIVELLTVMGVIALLIGLLAPALNAVRRIARDTKQKAQFNSIKAGLEMFKTDMGDYPISDNKPLWNSAAAATTGAQHLAEALLGRDLRGFDPQSTWDAQVDDTTNAAVIYANNSKSSAQQVTDCDNRRKGPYLDVENVGVFNADQLYCVGTTGTSSPGAIYGQTDTLNPAQNRPSPFITDVYADKTVAINYTTAAGNATKNLKAGTPVLYFKANPTNKDLRRQTAPAAGYTDRTYNYYDNEQVLLLGKMTAWNGATPAAGSPNYHPMSDNANNHERFYEAITNHQIPNLEGVAFHSDTYILMSAGRDGLFGTADDIYNFGD
jgi:type II secretory pathway pseudopilin PulG